MKSYIILFYKKPKDQISTAKYYRQFPTWEELIEWCKSVRDECNYHRFKTKSISLSKFLKESQAELSTHK